MSDKTLISIVNNRVNVEIGKESRMCDKALYYRRLPEQCTFSSLALPLITTPEYHPPVGGENKTTFFSVSYPFQPNWSVCNVCLVLCEKFWLFQPFHLIQFLHRQIQIKMKPLKPNLQMSFSQTEECVCSLSPVHIVVVHKKNVTQFLINNSDFNFCNLFGRELSSLPLTWLPVSHPDKLSFFHPHLVILFACCSPSTLY